MPRLTESYDPTKIILEHHTNSTAASHAEIARLRAEVAQLKTALAATYATSFDDGLAVGRRQAAEDVAIQLEGIAAEWREKAREE